MFGSLVVVYPTTHSGGSLVFRTRDTEQTFDTSSAITQASGPAVAFAVFFSDIEHEVTPVESGYRVTLTYNLYYTDKPPVPSTIPGPLGLHSSLEAAFKALLTDSTFLADGGKLGFGLRHEYPLDTRYTRESFRPLDYLEAALKGSDAVLWNVCKKLGLKASLNMIYEEQDGDHTEWNEARQRYVPKPIRILCPGNIDEGYSVCESSLSYYLTEDGGQMLTPSPWDEDEGPEVEVLWVTKMVPEGVKKSRTAGVTYGNEPSLMYIYGSVCIIVEVGEGDARAGLMAAT